MRTVVISCLFSCVFLLGCNKEDQNNHTEEKHNVSYAPEKNPSSKDEDTDHGSPGKIGEAMAKESRTHSDSSCEQSAVSTH